MSYSDGELYSYIDALLVDNFNEEISAAEMNDLLKKIIQSKPGLLDHESSRKYFQGQYVIYGGCLYKCIVASVQGTFNVAQWQLIISGRLPITLVCATTGQSEFDVSSAFIPYPEISHLNFEGWTGVYGELNDYHIAGGVLYFHSYFKLDSGEQLILTT